MNDGKMQTVGHANGSDERCRCSSGKGWAVGFSRGFSGGVFGWLFDGFLGCSFPFLLE